MKVSYNWLKSYVDFDLSPDELSTILTDIGLEVEGCEQKDEIKGGLHGVVIGEVLETSQHPNADRLKLTKVNIGTEVLPIVCGAPNVEAGQKVVVATVGTEIFPGEGEEGLKIKRAKIRGEESQGMICAEDELGLGKSHDGIIVLPNDTKVGIGAAEYYKLQSDYQIEIGLTPNRADAMSHIGVARDLKVYLNVNGASLDVKLPKVDVVEEGECPVSVEIQDPEACPKYLGVLLENIKISDSPTWLQSKLRSIGLAPINNVVDITNFVLHETGQPLHAFDANVVNGKVVVRKAKSGEKFTTLDEVEQELHQDDLMICNADQGMCIAGVFGGIDSGVSDSTTSIFLESAWFDPVTIRKGAKRHGMHTDASFRFERGVDPHMTEYALNRATTLLKEICGATVSGGMVKKQSREFPAFEVEFSPAQCNALIGEKIDDSYIRKVLTELEIGVEMKGDTWGLTIPPYRVDVLRQSDVIEEVLRIYGYNRVAIPSKVNATMAQFPKKDVNALRNSAANYLSSNGFSQIMNNSLTNKRYYKEEEYSELVEMLNPLSQDLGVMRATLINGGLEVIAYNQNRKNADLKLYEFGNEYRKTENGYKEDEKLVVFLTGKQNDESWHGTPDSNFFQLKSYIDGLIKKFGLTPQIDALENGAFNDGLSYKVNSKVCVELGWLSTDLLKSFDIKNDVFFAEIDWKHLVKAYKPAIVNQEVPKFPEVRRDLSLLIDKSVKFDDIKNLIGNSNKKLIKEIGLFDVYQGKNLDDDKKSYAVSIKIQDKEKTLTDKHVDKLMSGIISKLEEQLGAVLR